MAQIEPLVQSTSGRVVWGRVGVRREARDVDEWKSNAGGKGESKNQGRRIETEDRIGTYGEVRLG